MGHIVRREGDVYRVASTFAFSPEWDAAVRRLTFEPGRGSIVGRTLLAREAVQIADLAADPEYALPEVITIGKMRTGLGVPLLREGEPIGVIYLARQRVVPFTERQIELVRTFADQAVIAIENARLLSELQRPHRRPPGIARIPDRDQRRAEGHQPLDLRSPAGARTRCPKPPLGSVRAELAIMTRRDGEAYRLAASLGFPPEICALSEHSLDHARPRGSITGRVALEERVVHIARLYAPIRNTPCSRTIDFAKIRTALGVPLMREGSSIGRSSSGAQRVEPFTEKQIELVRTFADQAVIAMENARLLDEIRQRQAELRVTFDNMADGVAMFDDELRLAAWNRNFQESLDLPDEFLAERPQLCRLSSAISPSAASSATIDPEAELSRCTRTLRPSITASSAPARTAGSSRSATTRCRTAALC